MPAKYKSTKNFTISIIATVEQDSLLIGSSITPQNTSILPAIPSSTVLFEELTWGRVVIMGRVTYEAMGSKPLKNRLNIVLSRDKKYKPTGVITCNSIKEVLDVCQLACKRLKRKDVYVIGGAWMFNQFLFLSDNMYITSVKKIDKTRIEQGDIYFPSFLDTFSTGIELEAGKEEEYTYCISKYSSYTYDFEFA